MTIRYFWIKTIGYEKGEHKIHIHSLYFCMCEWVGGSAPGWRIRAGEHCRLEESQKFELRKHKKHKLNKLTSWKNNKIQNLQNPSHVGN